jgi:hypothetical protein
LALDAHRLGALLGEIAAIQQQHAAIVAACRVDFLPVLAQDAGIFPGARIDKRLQRADVLFMGPVQGRGAGMGAPTWADGR